MSVDPHRGAIDHEIFFIPGLTAQPAKDRRLQSVVGPRPESVVGALPIAEKWRQTSPRRSRAQNPKDRFNPQPEVLTSPATTLDPTQVVPMGLNFLSSSQSPSARTNLGG